MRAQITGWIGAIAILFFWSSALSAFQVADDNQNWRQQRKTLESALVKDLRPIYQWCRQNNLTPQAEQTAQWYLNRDLQRQYIFLPSEEPSAEPPQDPLQKQWLDKLNTALAAHAERVFALAKRAAAAEAGAIAYQFLHETLHYNRDHERARSILGHRKTENGWQIAADRLRIKTATRPHRTMNWPPTSMTPEISPPDFS